MKHTLLISLIILLCASQVLGLGLSVPFQREIIFSPGEQIKLTYVVQNQESQDTPILVTVLGKEVGAPLINETITIAPSSSKKYDIQFTLPQSLAPGIYSIMFKASETEIGGGMSASVAVGDTVYIVQPYDKGYPAEIISVRDRYVSNESVVFK